MNLITEIGLKIKRARDSENLSQRKLGRLCGVSYQTINRIENGYASNVTILTLHKICETLDLDIKEVLNIGNKTTKQ